MLASYCFPQAVLWPDPNTPWSLPVSQVTRPSFPIHNTESNPCSGCLGLAWGVNWYTAERIKGTKYSHISNLYSPHWTTKAVRVGSLLLLSCPACFCSLIQMYTYIPNEKAVHVNTVVWSNKQLWPYIYTLLIVGCSKTPLGHYALLVIRNIKGCF